MTRIDLDAIRAEMAEAMHANDCACGKTMYADHHTPEVPEWYAEMADAALRTITPLLVQLDQPDGA